MKVLPPNQSPEIGSQKSVIKTPQPGSGPSFEQVFNQAVDRQPSSVSQTPRAIQINRPSVVSNHPLTPTQESAAQVEATLEVLETYRSALADTHSTSLRQMEPLLSSMEAQRQTMEAAFDNLPADSPLREIGAQTSAAIIAEQGRFKSGIYN